MRGVQAVESTPAVLVLPPAWWGSLSLPPSWVSTIKDACFSHQVSEEPEVTQVNLELASEARWDPPGSQVGAGAGLSGGEGPARSEWAARGSPPTCITTGLGSGWEKGLP